MGHEGQGEWSGVDGVGGVRVCTAVEGGLTEGGPLSLPPEVSGGKSCCSAGGLSAERGSGLRRKLPPVKLLS